jgi:hypothetical protein
VRPAPEARPSAPAVPAFAPLRALISPSPMRHPRTVPTATAAKQSLARVTLIFVTNADIRIAFEKEVRTPRSANKRRAENRAAPSGIATPHVVRRADFKSWRTHLVKRGGRIMRNHPARYFNVALGFWLLVSTFLWRHDAAQFTVTWLSGVVTTFVALVSLGLPRLRVVNVVIGAWLIVSALALPHSTSGTVVHNVVVGALLVALGLSRTEEAPAGGRAVHAPG